VGSFWPTHLYFILCYNCARPKPNKKKKNKTPHPTPLYGFLFVAVLAMGLGAQTLPPPFPRPGVTQLLDNDRVTVWDVVWPKGQPTARHRHPYALAGVYLEPGDRVITDADGSKRSVTNAAGGITFQLKGLTHIEEGTSDAPLHAIMIEMKQDAPAGEDASPDLPPAFPREGAKQLLDNERVRIWDYAFTKGHAGPLHRHVRDAVVVWMTGGTLRSTPRGGAPTVTTLTKFTATYSPRGGVHSEEAIEGAPRAYVFELK
jgi:hypothetical protein